jgi:hypothetical protein
MPASTKVSSFLMASAQAFPNFPKPMTARCSGFMGAPQEIRLSTFMVFLFYRQLYLLLSCQPAELALDLTKYSISFLGFFSGVGPS